MISGILEVGFKTVKYSPTRTEIEVPSVFRLSLQGNDEVKLSAVDDRVWMKRDQLARCLEEILSIINERD